MPHDSERGKVIGGGVILSLILAVAGAFVLFAVWVDAHNNPTLPIAANNETLLFYASIAIGASLLALLITVLFAAFTRPRTG